MLSWRHRALYLALLAGVPFIVTTVLVWIGIGQLGMMTDGIGMAILSYAAFYGILFMFTLPAWFGLRMGHRPRVWKGVLIPAAVSIFLIIGFILVTPVFESNGPRHSMQALLTTIGTLSALCAIPGALIGWSMTHAHKKARARVSVIDIWD
ncbi:MAG: hypothetical protein AAFP97_05980 [Pseudomonadota bacterium]